MQSIVNRIDNNLGGYLPYKKADVANIASCAICYVSALLAFIKKKVKLISIIIVAFILLLGVFQIRSLYLASGWGSVNFAAILGNNCFKINTIKVFGDSHFGDAMLRDVLGIDSETSLYNYDIGDARLRLLTFPWVSDVIIGKVYPSQLRITIKERQPFAICARNGHSDIIDIDGVFIGMGKTATDAGFATKRKLPLIIGSVANPDDLQFINQLKRSSKIYDSVRAFVRVQDSRWDLLLDNGMIIKLPSLAAIETLQAAEANDLLYKLIKKDLKYIDLRNPESIVVKLNQAKIATSKIERSE